MLKKKGSRYRGFLSFDALFSVLVVLLMLFFFMKYFYLISDNVSYKLGQQQRFDRVAGIADYIVKKGAVKKFEISAGNSIVYPNWLEPDRIEDLDLEELGGDSGVSNLYVGLNSRPNDREVCIYRLVVVGNEREIAKLFVCGD